MTSTMMWPAKTTGTTTFGGHDARDGFCPVCGTVAPCYRARRGSQSTPSL